MSLFRFVLLLIAILVSSIFGQSPCTIPFTVSVSNLQSCEGQANVKITAVVKIGATTPNQNNYNFQWRIKENGIFRNMTTSLDNNNYTGFKSSSLNIKNTLIALNNAEYRCVATLKSNNTCTATSGSAFLNVIPKPTFISPTTNQTLSICKGVTAIFTTTIKDYSNSSTSKWLSKIGTNAAVEIINNFKESDGTKYEIINTPNGLNSYISTLKVSNTSTSVLNKNFYHSNIFSCNNTIFNSVNFRITFLPDNQITSQPSSKFICFDIATSVTLNSNAITNSVFKWQTFQNNTWSYVQDNTVFSGATTKDLKANILDLSLNNTKYRVEISGNCGSPVYSTEATITVLPKAKIVSTTPSPYYYCSNNGEINLQVVMTGNLAGVPTWSRNNVGTITNPFTGGTQTIITNTDGTQTLNFKISPADVIYNLNKFKISIPTCEATPVTSSDIETRANNLLFEATSTPAILELCEGGASKDVSTSTTPALTQQGMSYKWQKSTSNGGFVDINPTDPNFVISNAKITVKPLTGSIPILNNAKLRLVYANSCDTKNGPETILRVYPSLAVQISPSEAVICNGSNLTLNATANGPVTSYRWQMQAPTGTIFNNLTNNANQVFRILGANTAMLLISNVTNSPTARQNSKFRISIRGMCGTNIVSNISTLKIANVEYASPSVNLTSNKPYPTSGEEIEFTATTLNAGPTPFFKWYVNNAVIPTATNNKLLINTLKNNDIVKVELTPTVFCSGMTVSTQTYTTPIKNLIAILLKNSSNPHTFSIYTQDHNSTTLNTYTKNSLTEFNSIADDIDNDGIQDLGQLNLINLSALTSEIIILPKTSPQNDDTPLKLAVDYTTNRITGVLKRNQVETTFSTLESDLYTIDESTTGLTKFKLNIPEETNTSNPAFDFFTTNLTNETELKSTDQNFQVTIKSGVILSNPSLKIFKLQGETVDLVKEITVLSAVNQFTWDKKNSSNITISEGTYKYTITGNIGIASEAIEFSNQFIYK